MDVTRINLRELALRDLQRNNTEVSCGSLGMNGFVFVCLFLCRLLTGSEAQSQRGLYMTSASQPWDLETSVLTPEFLLTFSSAHFALIHVQGKQLWSFTDLRLCLSLGD